MTKRRRGCVDEKKPIVLKLTPRQLRALNQGAAVRQTIRGVVVEVVADRPPNKPEDRNR